MFMSKDVVVEESDDDVEQWVDDDDEKKMDSTLSAISLLPYFWSRV
jgi:hypothetical protein